MLPWGCAAWHLKEDALRMADQALVRMDRFVLSLRKPEDEPLLQWHTRTWKQSSGAIAAVWGCTPVAVVAAFAASMAVRLATRAACSREGWALRGRSEADAQVMKDLGRGRLGEWARRRTRRPKARSEDSWVEAFGLEWWLHVATAPSRQVATARVNEWFPTAEGPWIPV